MLSECQHQLREEDADNPVVFVAVHVWRNQTAKWLSRKYRRRVGADYFRSAMSHFRSAGAARLGGKPLFVVATDDALWVREHLTGPDVCVLGAAKHHVDLAVQASCTHSVVDMTAPSLAAALLAGYGETVAPSVDVDHAAQLANMPGWFFI